MFLVFLCLTDIVSLLILVVLFILFGQSGAWNLSYLVFLDDLHRVNPFRFSVNPFRVLVSIRAFLMLYFFSKMADS